MIKKYQSIVGLWCLLVTNGCTIIPGSHFEGMSVNEQTQQLDEVLNQVNLQLINPELLNRNKIADKPHQVASQQGLDVTNYQYRLGKGDVLSIGVWDHPELTIPAAVQRTAEFDGFRVQADGTISYAYADKVVAAGKTVSEVRYALLSRLGKVIENPQIDVKVVGFNSQKLYVTGEVNRPGVYAITETPTTLIDALNQAGGLNEQADWRTVTFIRGQITERIYLDDFYSRGDLSQNRLLQHGDIVHVHRNDKRNVYVLGDVNKAGKVEINRYGLNLAEAIAAASGINERTADANGIFVLRKRDVNPDGLIADVFQLQAKNIAAMVLAEQFELQPQDIVYVTSAPLARWNKVISLLIPVLTTVDRAQDIDNQ